MSPVTSPATSVATFGTSKVLIALPWQKQVSPITATCMAQLIDRRRCASSLHFGDAFVAHTRNSIADTFLASKCEWMLTIDDDMVVPFGDAKWFKFYTGFNFPDQFMCLNALDRLMSHGKTLVGALYFGRNPGAFPVYCEGREEFSFAKNAPHDVCKVTKWVGTGCMLIHRSVYEAIEVRFPRLARASNDGRGQWFTSTEANLLDHVTKAANMLQHDRTPEGVNNTLNLLTHAVAVSKADNWLGSGEDVSFCLRAAAAGHPAHVDMGLVCGHLGTFCYGPRNPLQ